VLNGDPAPHPQKGGDEDTADFEVLRDVAMATSFGFLMGCTFAPPEEYD